MGKGKNLRKILIPVTLIGAGVIGSVLWKASSNLKHLENPVSIVKVDEKENKGFQRGREFFAYKDGRTSIGYIFNKDDLLNPEDSHPIYGTTSGTITTNPKMEVILEIPKDLSSGVERIIIGDEDFLSKGTLNDKTPIFKRRYRIPSFVEGEADFVYWYGKLDLNSGDNFFSPIVKFTNGKWSGVGVDWRYITLFESEKQAREYAQNPRRAFNTYSGTFPILTRTKAEKEMTQQLNEIIEKAVKEGKLK